MNNASYIVSVKLLIVLIISSLTLSCKKAVVEPYEPWGFKPKSYFPSPVYTFKDNELNYAQFILGRALFYDPYLSSDSTISCASCHDQTHAFGGHNTPLSAGVNNLLGNRNSPAIFNLAWSPTFMWDGGINHIEIMPVAPLTNPVEMNETVLNILNKLALTPKYKELFKQAYGTEEITEQKMLKSLAQFLSMIVSDNSKYDKVKEGKETFSADEQKGYELFVQKCSQCHKEPLFTDYT